MRPIRLTMQAFGPYAGRQELQMDALGETGLYAITGETGAGKTTIFDAIVYALYGSGSGEDRGDGKGFRSAAADPAMETRVELEFVSGGKTYRVERRPEQAVAGKRKDDLVVRAAAQTLTLPDGTKLTRAKEIDERIERDILGVTKDQFCQIVMIAQGEFRKLLRADTKERTKILRRIFRTERFDALSRQMDRLCREKYRELRSSREQVGFSLKTLQAEPGSPICAPLEALKQVEADALILEDAVALTGRIAEADAADADAAKACLDRAAAEKDAAKRALDVAADQLGKRRELEGLRADRDRLVKDLASAQARYRSAKAAETDIERLGREITLEEEVLPKYAALEALEGERSRILGELGKLEDEKKAAEAQAAALKAKRTALEREAEGLADAPERLVEAARALNEARNAEKKLAGLRARVEASDGTRLRLDECRAALGVATRAEQDAEARLDALRRELDGLGNTGLTLSTLSVERQRLESGGQALSRLAALIDDYAAVKDELQRARDLCRGAGVEAERLRGEAVALRFRYNANIAGIWASELKEGEPCPVCGSLRHPNKACLTGEAVTEQAARDAEDAAARAEKAYNAQALVCAAKAEACEGLKRQAAEQLPEIEESDWTGEVERQQAANAREQAALEARIKSAEGADARRRRIEEAELRLAQEASREAVEARQSAETAMAAAKTDHDTALREVDAAAKGLMPEGWTPLDLSDAIAENARALRQWEGAEKRSRADQQRLAAVGNEVEAISRELQTVAERIEAARVEITGRSARLEGCEAQLAALLRQLPHPDRAACEASVARGKEGKASLEKAIEDSRQATSALEQSVAGKAAEIRRLEEETRDHPPLDVAAAQAACDEKEAAWRAAADREKAVHARRTNNADQIRNLVRMADQAQKLEREYRVMKDVSDTANGDVAGQERLTLETYVQTAYFDRILGYANRRLIHMSRHRYDLARQHAEDGDRRAKTGLELDVVDHANGTRRAVSTLSGGEGFLASLSLALGMSDAIQASATSAVQLDTMFVDEGFGSLSEQYLGLVMDELNDTANTGHRLIGVISHVDDVKEGIERRIEVSKSDSGVSTARIV